MFNWSHSFIICHGSEYQTPLISNNYSMRSHTALSQAGTESSITLAEDEVLWKTCFHKSLRRKRCWRRPRSERFLEKIN